MKKYLLITLASLTFLYPQKINQDQLVVSGEYETKVMTDQAHLSFSIEGLGPSLKDAFEVTHQKGSQITKKLLDLGIPEEGLYTSEFHTGENYNGKAFLRNDRDYKTSIKIYLTIDSLALLEPVVILLSESDVQSISNISYSLKNMEKLKHEVLLQATNNAKIKAKSISDNLGIRLGKVYRFEDAGSSVQFDRMMNPRAKKVTQNQNRTFFAQPNIIKARVRVFYEINNDEAK